ncbi:MAG TPA: ATP-binding protein [Nocardioides sp.]|nr:ATP-binding protein [Nocardioides sp.]
MQDARRWVVGTCADIGRDDLIECAEIAVSELVTNALLHAEAPISVRVRGTREHPRVEVRDGSRLVPELPPTTTPQDEAELLLTFGRGLSIVARASDAWGVDLDDEGKVVWFAPATAFAEHIGTEGRVTGTSGEDEADGEDDGEADIDLVDFSIRGIPVHDYITSTRHYRELRREIRLLALAHQDDYPLAKNLSDLFGAMDQPARAQVGTQQIEAAYAAGEETTDLELTLPRRIVERVDLFIEMLDLADEFCRAERLLSVARTPEERAFQTWFLREFVRQAGGEKPQPWSASVAEDRESSHS